MGGTPGQQATPDGMHPAHGMFNMNQMMAAMNPQGFMAAGAPQQTPHQAAFMQTPGAGQQMTEKGQGSMSNRTGPQAEQQNGTSMAKGSQQKKNRNKKRTATAGQ